MNMYTVKRWTGKWEDIPSLDIAEKYRKTPDTVTARAQIAFDEDNLYVRLETEEYEHRNVETGPIGMPCEDSCLEFFFSPVEGDTRYFNIEFNSNCCMYLGMGHSIDDLVRLIPDEKGADVLSPKVEMKDGGWSIEYTIPVSFVKIFFPYFSLYAGKRMRANCYKCADKTEPPHYLSWNPVTTDNFTFHRSECFGEMIFAN